MTGTILLVEDEENDVLFMRWAVGQAGVRNRLHVAIDGREAVDYLQGAGRFADREEFPLPCLVLLDLKLPYVMGLDVLKWIRQRPELAPIVIILSASAAEADITAAYRLGADGYVVKPCGNHKLVDMVKTIKDLWLTLPEGPGPSAGESGEAPGPGPRRASVRSRGLPPPGFAQRFHGPIDEDDPSAVG